MRHDPTRTVSTDVLEQTQSGLGVLAVDVTRSRHPRLAATATTPTMLSPHESLLLEPLEQHRGLLAAVLGNALAGPGVLEMCDVAPDRRRPRLVRRPPQPLLGHGSDWSSDGRTFYTPAPAGRRSSPSTSPTPRAPAPRCRSAA